MRLPTLLVAGAVATSTLAVAAPSATTPLSADDAVTRVIVKFDGEMIPADLETTLESIGVRGVAFETINSVALTGPAAGVEVITSRADVVGVHQQRKLDLHLANSVPYIGGGDALAGVQDTFTYGTGDSTSTVTRPATDGSTSTVAVLDTGIFDLHPDLAGSVIAHRNFELAYLVNDFLADAVEIDEFAEATGATAKEDDIGHGTHVGGIVAGRGIAAQGRQNDNKGVAPGAKLVDLRIAAGPVQGLVNDMGWEANAIAAFDWLLRHQDDTEFGPNGIEINTNSWGLLPGDFYDGPNFEPLQEIIEKLEDAGQVTIFSAGNDGVGDDVRDDTIPNGLPEVISVAASCHPGAASNSCVPAMPDRSIGDFSSRGASVDIAAPGVDIVSAMNPASYIWGLGQLTGNWDGTEAHHAAINRAAYGSLDGTSMAAPHAAGVAALLMSVNHDLTPIDVRTIMAATAKDILAPGRDEGAGYGLVQIQPALRAATRLANGETIEEVFPDFTFESCTPLGAVRQCQG